MDTIKTTLRAEAKARRDAIDPVSADPERAVRLFMETIRPGPDQVVALYHPKGSEFDTLPLLQALTRHSIKCALPIVDKGQRRLRFALWNEGEALETGIYRLSQPLASAPVVDPDIVVVPLLAFDRRCHRLGYGAGHYDETLHTLRARKEIMAVGLAYAAQEVSLLPDDSHDEKLDCIVTPEGVLFTG
jgi:5-formyltetrahydrofolate cyclo-ligase